MRNFAWFLCALAGALGVASGEQHAADGQRATVILVTSRDGNQVALSLAETDPPAWWFPMIFGPRDRRVR